VPIGWNGRLAPPITAGDAGKAGVDWGEVKRCAPVAIEIKAEATTIATLSSLMAHACYP
jgi:hypothetical protein